jgi:hypothetical protein
MKRTPSIKKLASVFGDKAKEAKRILNMTREELEATEDGDKLTRLCYHKPALQHLRLTVLDGLAGTVGVESLETKRGICEYLNMGDPYSTTLLWWNGAYRVGCWGDIAEKYGIE